MRGLLRLTTGGSYNIIAVQMQIICVCIFFRFNLLFNFGSISGVPYVALSFGGDITQATDFNHIIHQRGLKSTKIRLSILTILSQSEQPLDAPQMLLALKAQNISANLSTVYRTLEVLAQKELITELNLPGAHRMLYAINRRDHRHYLMCLGCKKMIAVEGCPLSDFEKQLEQQTGYLISAHQLNLYGYCPVCRQKNLP